MNRRLAMIMSACLVAGCAADPALNDENTATPPVAGRVSAAAFDGPWTWVDGDGTPQYRITIANGEVVGLDLASNAARRIPFERCRCHIDDVDGLQFIELLGMPSSTGERVRHCFTFMEHPSRHHGCLGDTAEGHYFEELVTDDDHPLPRLRMRSGRLVRG